MNNNDTWFKRVVVADRYTWFWRVIIGLFIAYGLYLRHLSGRNASVVSFFNWLF